MLSGINRGLQLIADYLRLRMRVEQKDPSPAVVGDFDRVAEIWVQEVTDASGNVKISLLTLLFGDPFRASRSAYYELKRKYEG